MKPEHKHHRPVDLLFPGLRRDAFENKKCVNPPIGCGRPVTGFKDEISRQEYEISGLCQDCQDQVFGQEAGDNY